MASQTPLDSQTQATVICALVHYGLACADGTHCVDALRALGAHKAADVLAAALDARRKAA